MKKADMAIVYFNPDTLAHKKLTPITNKQTMDAFGSDDLLIYTDSNLLNKDLKNMNWNNTNLLMMSSGNFNGLDFQDLAEKIIVIRT